jgi:drug/metabolite transporter (DMT)-like permease
MPFFSRGEAPSYDPTMTSTRQPLENDFSATSIRRPGLYYTLAPVLAILSCVLYSCNGELLQYMQLHAGSGGHASPLLNLIICHMGGLVFVPHFLFWKPAGIFDGGLSVPVGSLLLAFILMGYNYAWLSSARFLAAGLTNAIFQTSIAFVCFANAIVFREKLEGIQLLGVGFALGGSFLASGYENTPSTQTSQSDVRLGIFLALIASVGMMLYQVLFKYLYGHLKNDARFLAHIGAWVSVWHVVAIFPLACVAHAAGFEAMQLPHSNLAVFGTLLSACIASTVNAMYICIVMWGSAMLLPCASALSVPFTVALDMALHHVVPGKLEMTGHFMVVLSVVLIMGFRSTFPGHLSKGHSHLVNGPSAP